MSAAARVLDAVAFVAFVAFALAVITHFALGLVVDWIGAGE